MFKPCFKRYSLEPYFSTMSTMLTLLLAGHFSCLALASEGGEKNIRQVIESLGGYVRVQATARLYGCFQK